MVNFKVQKLFNKLEKDFKSYKVKKYQKEQSMPHFISRIKNANNNIHLFGINFPNYFFNTNHQIIRALRDLNLTGKKIDLYLYIPNNQLLRDIDMFNIYERKSLLYKKNRLFINQTKNIFENINIKIIEYDRFYKFGASSIDLGMSDAFLHLSKAQKNEYIRSAEYFNIEYNKIKNTINKKIFDDMNNFFKTLQKISIESRKIL